MSNPIQDSIFLDTSGSFPYTIERLRPVKFPDDRQNYFLPHKRYSDLLSPKNLTTCFFLIYIAIEFSIV